MNDIIEAKKVFKYRIEVLRQFDFAGKEWQQAIWPIPKQVNRYVWIANLGEYDGGHNKLSEDGLTFTDRREPKTPGADSYGTHHNTEIERILFLKTLRFGGTIFEFEGVFKPDVQKSVRNVSVWERVSHKCSLPDGSWQTSDVSK